MTKKCDWDSCLIVKIINEIGIDAFAEGVKEEKRKSAGLLMDGPSMALFIHYHGSASSMIKEEK